jgi:hypothetical protein
VLCVVRGAGARADADMLARASGVDLAFPVGRQVKLWLKEGASAAALQAELAKRQPDLEVVTAMPSLHDVALRELALAERGHGRG